MTFRKIVFWSHLVVGVAAGLVVLVLAATGVLLTYEVQIARWAAHRVDITAGPMLDAEALAGAAQAQTGGAATALVFENDTTAPVTATYGRGAKLLLDPATGASLGDGATGVHRFFDAVTGLHRHLSPAGSGGAGRAVTGAANLGFLFLALSGAYLWLPKVWRWARIRTLVLLRRRYPSARARDYHWHHIFGIWALIPLVLIAFTGVTLSYDRVQGVVMTLAGVGAQEDGPARGAGAAEATPRLPADSAGAAEATPRLPARGAGLDALLAAARAHDPGWRRLTLELPQSPGAETVTVTVDAGPGRRESRKQTLTIARDDARILEVRRFADQPKAARTFWFLRFAHTGEHFGIVGQTLAGLAALATVVMVYTGLALAWRRLVAPVLRRRRRESP